VFLSGYSGFLHHLNWSPWYSWNIVESVVKTPNNQIIKRCRCRSNNQEGKGWDVIDRLISVTLLCLSWSRNSIFNVICRGFLLHSIQLYHGDQFKWCRKPEYPERNTDHGQGTGKLYHLRLLVESSLFCNLQSRARTHAVLVIGLYELLDPTT
jgi:hypothetical protein